MSSALKDFFASWPVSTTTLEKTRQQVVAELRASFDATDMVAPCCSSSADEPLFHHNDRAAPSSTMCSPGSNKDGVSPTTSTAEDNTSTTTSSTFEESIVSSENNTGVVVRRLGRVDAINDTKKRSRKRRPRRRVCLLENCDCPYHHALEERSMGPIDVDSICEERQIMTESSRHESNATVEEVKSQSSNHASEPVSGTTAHCENTSTTSWEYFPSARADGCFDVAKQSKENGETRKTKGDDQLLPRFTGDLESSEPFVPRGISWNTVDGTVLDEIEMSRGLVGYQEGCEPEVIAQYTVLDVKRWELEHENEEDDTFHQISSPPSHTSHSRGSSSRQSRSSREGRSRQSRQTRSHHTGTSASTTYPRSIPASAAEV